MLDLHLPRNITTCSSFAAVNSCNWSECISSSLSLSSWTSTEKSPFFWIIQTTNSDAVSLFTFSDFSKSKCCLTFINPSMSCAVPITTLKHKTNYRCSHQALKYWSQFHTTYANKHQYNLGVAEYCPNSYLYCCFRTTNGAASCACTQTWEHDTWYDTGRNVGWGLSHSPKTHTLNYYLLCDCKVQIITQHITYNKDTDHYRVNI